MYVELEAERSRKWKHSFKVPQKCTSTQYLTCVLSHISTALNLHIHVQKPFMPNYMQIWANFSNKNTLTGYTHNIRNESFLWTDMFVLIAQWGKGGPGNPKMTDTLFWSCLLPWPASGKGGAMSPHRKTHAQQISVCLERVGRGAWEAKTKPLFQQQLWLHDNTSQSPTWDMSDCYRQTKYKQRCVGSCRMTDWF